uniref:Putative lipoprotein n=1 Tax=Teredinibacter turnerae TaxID=2426 RepID=UPI0030131E68
EPVVDTPHPGEALYEAQCASCHGKDGKGGLAGGELLGCDVCGDFSLLALRIEQTMPLGNPEQCDTQCSSQIAGYMLENFAGLPPTLEHHHHHH